MAASNVPAVMEWLENHPNKLITATEIVRSTQVNKGTVSSILARLSNEGQINRIARGVYRYEPEASPALNGDHPHTGTLVEIIGTTRDGRSFGEGDDGRLWVLTPVTDA